jgi:hypothetical protein
VYFNATSAGFNPNKPTTCAFNASKEAPVKEKRRISSLKVSFTLVSDAISISSICVD